MKQCWPCSGISFVILLTIQYGAMDTPSARKLNVWTNTPGNIIVLEGTTAFFNWTHNIKGNVHIQWEHIDRNGTRKQISSYAWGHIDNSTTAGRITRANYKIFPGSATMTLENVTAFDEGIFIVNIALSSPIDIANDVDTSNATMRVIPASDVKMKITLNGEVFTRSVAVDGRNITLLEGNVVFIENPRVVIEVADIVPTPLSITLDTQIPERRQCMSCRELDSSWSQEVVIKIAFDIQNLETVYISRHIQNQVPWQTVPETALVLAQTDAILNWTYAITHPVNILWHYRNNRTDREQLMMECIDDKVTVPKYIQTHIEYVYHNTLRSAAIKLHDVAKKDEGLYEVTLVDPSASTQNTINVAELKVVEGRALAFSVLIDSNRTRLSVFNNGTNITLPELTLEVPSQHSIEVDIEDNAPNAEFIDISNDMYCETETCTNNRSCKRYINFERDLREGIENKMTIYIGFGIQNLDTIVVQYRLTLVSSSSTQTGEESGPAENTYWDFGRLITTILMVLFFLTSVALAVLYYRVCKKWVSTRTPPSEHGARDDERHNKDIELTYRPSLQHGICDEKNNETVSTGEDRLLPLALPHYLNETPFKYHVCVVHNGSQHDSLLKRLEDVISSAGLVVRIHATDNQTLKGIGYSMSIIILLTKDCMNSGQFRKDIPIIKETANTDMVVVARAPGVTKEDLNDFGLGSFYSVEISQNNQDLLRDINRAEVFRSRGIRPNLGWAMAINYYHGYLSIVLPGFKERLTKELLVYTDVNSSHKESTPAGKEDYEQIISHKLFIIITEKCQENKLKSCEISEVPFKVPRAEQQNIDYSTLLCKVKDDKKRKVYYFMYDFPSILVNMLHMAPSEDISAERGSSREIRHFIFYLTSLIQDDTECCGNCSVLSYRSDEQSKSLTEVLCERIEYEADIERKNLDRRTDDCEISNEESDKSTDVQSEDDSTPADSLLQSKDDSTPADPLLQSKDDSTPADPLLQSKDDSTPADALLQSKDDSTPADALLQSKDDSTPADALLEQPHLRIRRMQYE